MIQLFETCMHILTLSIFFAECDTTTLLAIATLDFKAWLPLFQKNNIRSIYFLNIYNKIYQKYYSTKIVIAKWRSIFKYIYIYM